jgi:hypothetical protein
MQVNTINCSRCAQRQILDNWLYQITYFTNKRRYERWRLINTQHMLHADLRGTTAWCLQSITGPFCRELSTVGTDQPWTLLVTQKKGRKVRPCTFSAKTERIENKNGKGIPFLFHREIVRPVHLSTRYRSLLSNSRPGLNQTIALCLTLAAP